MFILSLFRCKHNVELIISKYFTAFTVDLKIIMKPTAVDFIDFHIITCSECLSGLGVMQVLFLSPSFHVTINVPSGLIKLNLDLS